LVQGRQDAYPWSGTVISVRNLAWLRSLSLPDMPDFGSRMNEIVSDLMGGTNTLEQQTNSNLNGTPAPPPAPDALSIVPHPQGVQFSISHNADFYQGITYEIDATAGGITHTHDVGTSRNGILPVGNLTATYQVRARYPTGASTRAVPFSGSVAGGSGSPTLLPSQGAGTTRAGQPPGFGGPYRGSKPPIRGTK
jgi:hypothetical protein